MWHCTALLWFLWSYSWPWCMFLCCSCDWPLIFDLLYLSNIYSTWALVSWISVQSVLLSSVACPLPLIAQCASSVWQTDRCYPAERERVKETFVLPAQTHTSQMTHSHAGEQKRRSDTGADRKSIILLGERWRDEERVLKWEQENRGQIHFGTDLYVFGALRRRIEKSWWNKYYWGKEKERTAWIAFEEISWEKWEGEEISPPFLEWL